MHSWLVSIVVVATLWFLDFFLDKAVAVEGDGVSLLMGFQNCIFFSYIKMTDKYSDYPRI
jgi:hypothetical protein